MGEASVVSALEKWKSTCPRYPTQFRFPASVPRSFIFIFSFLFLQIFSINCVPVPCHGSPTRSRRRGAPQQKKNEARQARPRQISGCGDCTTRQSGRVGPLWRPFIAFVVAASLFSGMLWASRTAVAGLRHASPRCCLRHPREASRSTSMCLRVPIGRCKLLVSPISMPCGLLDSSSLRKARRDQHLASAMCLLRGLRVASSYTASPISSAPQGKLPLPTSLPNVESFRPIARVSARAVQVSHLPVCERHLGPYLEAEASKMSEAAESKVFIWK